MIEENKLKKTQSETKKSLPILNKSRLGLNLLGGEVEEDLLEISLRHDVVLDAELVLDVLDEREETGEEACRVVADVDVDEAVT